MARDYFTEADATAATAFTQYLARDAPFKEHLFSQNCTPSAWWRAGAVTGFPEALTALALRLSACVASSAGLERCFSTMGHGEAIFYSASKKKKQSCVRQLMTFQVYGTLRTRLGPERAGKLAFVFRQLNRKH